MMVFLYTCEIKYSLLLIRTSTYFLLITSDKWSCYYMKCINKIRHRNLPKT